MHPPELIEEFVKSGTRATTSTASAKREATLFLRVAYKLFYRLFQK